MSGIAVICNLDGSPADAQLMERMLDAIAHRAVDGRGAWLSGGVALGQAMMRTTPEAARERQPHRDGDVCLVLDGRVDNRAELQAELEAHGMPPREDTDAELVLRAWRCWGEDSPRRIIGDFAYAIWDGKRRELFCARDTGGIRPFYYFCDGRTMLCGSELHQLLKSSAVPREPNEGVIADCLCATMTSIDETLFRDVKRLPPAHCLIADSRGIKIRRYYDLDPARPIRYGSDEQYAEHFLEVFKEAVRCRMRAVSGLAAELSGGLDSSSIVVTALAMQREGSAPAIPLEAFSVLYDEPECDERNYAQEVARAAGIGCNFVEPTLLDYAKCLEQVRRYKDLPDYINGANSDGLREEARRRGLKVVLTGLGGDQWLQGSELFLCDFIVGFRWGELFHQLHLDRRFGPLDSWTKRLKVLLRYGVRPVLPRPMVRCLRALLLRPRLYPSSIERGFARRVKLRRRLTGALPRPAGMNYAQRSFYDDWSSPWLCHGLEITDRNAVWAGVEERHPFFDRRVIEFCFAIPEEQRARLDLTKFVLRGAMKGLLPESIRKRRSKGQLGRFFMDVFNQVGGESLFERMAMEQKGWLSAARMRRLCRERLAAYPASNLWPLWSAFALDLWYRETFAHSAKRAARCDDTARPIAASASTLARLPRVDGPGRI